MQFNNVGAKMEEENQVEEEVVEIEEDSVSDDIRKAMESLEGADEPQENAEDAPKEEVVQEQEKVIDPPPQSLNAEEKQEWPNLSEKARNIILRREQDYHKAITNQDGERLFGRDIKEVVTPYMAEIAAAGSTPAKTIGNLLNTVYQLKNGNEATRLGLIKQIAADYNVNLQTAVESDEYVDPTIANLQKEIQQLRIIADPNNIKQDLTQEMNDAKIHAEIDAFASDSANVHFHKVRPLMASIIGNDPSKSLREAYDIACKADPQVSSMLEAQRNAELKAKQKQEIAAKKRAASSVTGSPAISNSAKTNPNKSSSIADDIRAVWDDLESSI